MKTNEIYYGSQNTPTINDVENFFCGSKIIYEENVNKTDKSSLWDIRIFNIRNFMILHLLQLIAGLRPRKYYDFLDEKNFDGNILYISDKKIRGQQGEKYYRLIFLCPEFKKILEEHKLYIKRFVELNFRIGKLESTEISNCLILFLKEKENEIEQIAYGKKIFSYYLHKINNIFPMQKEYRPNFLRHFLKTYLHNYGIDHSIANAIMGHKDYIDIYSLSSNISYKKTIVPIMLKIQEEFNEMFKLTELFIFNK